MNMNLKLNGIMMLFLALGFFSSCNDDDTDNPSVEMASFDLSLDGLEDLGSAYAYEGWIIVDGSPVTTGVFTIDADGNASASNFEVAKSDLDAATAFVLTIEPSPDNDPAPSAVHILAGDISGGSADLTIDHGAALATDFNSVGGNYILATPTDSDETNENSGIWFLDNSSGIAQEGLDLPSLPEGWMYEGWVVIDGVPVTTGTFSSASGADNFDGFSGANGGPPYPGEDFLQNAPSGLSFPVDLSGKTAVISVEPFPDNSPAPFALKPLVGAIPENAPTHSIIEIGQNLVFPSGSIERI